MDWEERLANAGRRITAPRRAVMEVLHGASAPLPPHEILKRGRSIHTKLGLVTVYRTLALLTRFDLVRRVHHESSCQGYVLASPGHRHHVVCRGCGGAAEFLGEDDIQPLIDRVESGTSYRVDDHLLQLFGLCPGCQERPAPPEASR
ncbi:MAG: transcriptional repressor [Anaerolineales bacterium]|nr:MAG: transcriptional repressor [Anaerolineales bacterium]